MTPHFGINAEGLLWKVVGIPTKYSFGTYTGLYCCVTSALCAAYLYRYRLLFSSTSVKYSNRVLTTIIACTYIITVGISLPLATLAFKDHDESVAEVRKIDSKVYLGDSFIFLEGPTFLLWIYYATVLAVVTLVVLVVISRHTSIILRNQARFSEISRKMHQNAISGLVAQITTITMTVCVPVFMLCISFYIGPSLITSTDAYMWVGSVTFSMKSFNGTMAMIVMTSCYRKHFMRVTGLTRIWPKVDSALVVAPAITSSSN